MSNNDKASLTHPNTVLLRLLDKEFHVPGLDYRRGQDRPKNDLPRPRREPLHVQDDLVHGPGGVKTTAENVHPVDHAVNVHLYSLLGDFATAGWERTLVISDVTTGRGTSTGDSFRTTLAFNPPGHSEPPLADNSRRDEAIEAAFWPMQYADEVAAHRAANEWFRLHPGDVAGAKEAAFAAAEKALGGGDIAKIANATVAAINWDEKSRAVAGGDHNHGVQGKVVCADLHVWVNVGTTTVNFSRRGTSPVEGEPVFALRFNPSAPSLEQCWWLEDEAGNKVTAEETRRRVAAYCADKDAEREAFVAWNRVVKPVIARGDSPFTRWGEAMGRADAMAYSVYVKVFSPEEAATKAKALIAGINWKAKADKLIAKRARRFGDSHSE